MLFGKKDRQNPWHNTIMEQIRNLESGDLTGIRRRSMYGSLTKKLTEKILSALEENREKLPDGVEKGILFDMKFLAK